MLDSPCCACGQGKGQGLAAEQIGDGFLLGGVIWNPVLRIISGPVDTTLCGTHLLAIKVVMISGLSVAGRHFVFC